jgi:hypothetical protein
LHGSGHNGQVKTGKEQKRLMEVPVCEVCPCPCSNARRSRSL